VPTTGDVFVQSDLAGVLQHMADEEKAASGKGRVAGLDAARHAFYKGDIARRILAFHEAHGGLMTARDLAEFRVGVEPALTGRFADMQVYTCGPTAKPITATRASSTCRWRRCCRRPIPASAAR
jgi:gamma-glutamyltranspeptidase / glutathione hydrolase